MSCFELRLNNQIILADWQDARAVFEEKRKASFIGSDSKWEILKATIQEEFAAHLLDVHFMCCQHCELFPTNLRRGGGRRFGLNRAEDTDGSSADLVGAPAHTNINNSPISTVTKKPSNENDGFQINTPDNVDDIKCQDDIHQASLQASDPCRLDEEMAPADVGTAPDGPTDSRDAILDFINVGGLDGDVSISKSADLTNEDTDSENINESLSNSLDPEYRVNMLPPCPLNVDCSTEFKNTPKSIIDLGFQGALYDEKLTSKSSFHTHQSAYSDEEEDGVQENNCREDQIFSGEHTGNVIDNDTTLGTEKAFKCSLCVKSFGSKQHLQRHMTSHSGEKPFQCSICPKRFAHREYVRTHMKSHNVEKPFKCSDCTKSFSKRRELHVHERTHTGERPYQCSFCDKTFRGKGTLNSHLALHKFKEEDPTSAEAKSFKCSICIKSFFSKQHLMRHMSSHTNEKPYQCPVCPKRFGHKEYLSTHMKLHLDEKPYKCSECTKSFTKKGELLVHERSHTGERPFQCSLCDKTFKSKGNLNSHLAVHKFRGEDPNGIEAKPFNCSICTKSFVSKQHLKRHMTSHTEEKPYQCPVCPKRFGHQEYLHTHMKLHLEDKPFKCTQCTKSFIKKGELLVHERSHTGERPFQCTICDKGFTGKGNLNRHLALHKARKNDATNLESCEKNS